VPIEQVRSLLVIALCVVLFLMWQQWQKDYGPQPAGEPPAGAQERAPDSTAAGPARDAPPADGPRRGRPDDVPASPTTGAAGAPAPVPAQQADAPAGPPRVRVRTDVLDLEIDPRGGDIVGASLLEHAQSLQRPDAPVRLLSALPPDLFVAQSGLLGDAGAPNHHSEFTPERTSYELADGEDGLEVRLRWTGEEGLSVTKIYRLRRDSYAIDVVHRVENGTGAVWRGRMYGQLKRARTQEERGLFRVYTYTGGVISTDEKPYEKVDFGDMAKADLARATEGGWAGMIQHYFASAWVPDQEGRSHLYSKALGGEQYVLGVISPERALAPGAGDALSQVLYVGPKVQDRLEAVAPHLERTVDYGWLWFISEPLFWLLEKIHALLGNWGWSIIVLTIIIKLAFFQLSATSYKSMARMRKLQPRMVQLRERYGEDKQKLNQAMMQMYKDEKVNPLSGCLPILVQIPVFIALYWVLLESVELRHAPFMLWIQDLSTRDPYFVLPILMGASMFVQQKLNPPPPDPMQAKIMMALPFVFTFFFLAFPSGLVLYWFVNNVLSIAQQWVITKRIAPESL